MCLGQDSCPKHLTMVLNPSRYARVEKDGSGWKRYEHVANVSTCFNQLSQHFPTCSLKSKRLPVACAMGRPGQKQLPVSIAVWLSWGPSHEEQTKSQNRSEQIRTLQAFASTSCYPSIPPWSEKYAKMPSRQAITFTDRPTTLRGRKGSEGSDRVRWTSCSRPTSFHINPYHPFQEYATVRSNSKILDDLWWSCGFRMSHGCPAAIAQTPVQRLGVSGGTAPFFKLVLLEPQPSSEMCPWSAQQPTGRCCSVVNASGLG